MISEEQKNRLEKLVLSCGEILTARNDVENEVGGVTVKPGDANFVTVFDVKVQELLIGGLREIFPDAVFFAEEQDNSAVDLSRGKCFVIDPIDGTTNFIHGMNWSGISVGMLSDGEPVLGVIYDPFRGEYYFAAKGQGAYRNGERIHVSERPLDKALIAFGTSPYRKGEFSEDSFRKAHEIFLRCADLRRSGSAALDLYNVACGRMDAFFEFTLSPWDYAAGAVIVTEAGGKLTGFDGKSVPFDRQGSMLCSNGLIHEELRAILCE